MDESFIRKILGPLAFMSVISSMAGISLMLRNNEKVRPRDIFAAVMASVAACVIVYLLLHQYLQERQPLLMGVSCLAGAGGASTFDLLFVMLKKQLEKRGVLPPADDSGGDPEEG